MLEPKLGESVLGNYSLGIPQNEKVKDGVDFWEFACSINASIEKDIAKSKQFSEMSVLSMLFSQVYCNPPLLWLSKLMTQSTGLRFLLFSVYTAVYRNLLLLVFLFPTAIYSLRFLLLSVCTIVCRIHLLFVFFPAAIYQFEISAILCIHHCIL
jgi:hypothetical protein